MRTLNGRFMYSGRERSEGLLPYLIIVAMHQLLYEEFDHRQGKVF